MVSLCIYEVLQECIEAALLPGQVFRAPHA
jgi:hypothetical protein